MESIKVVSVPTVNLKELSVSETHKCISCGDKLAIVCDDGRFVCINNSTTEKCFRYGLVTVISTETVEKKIATTCVLSDYRNPLCSGMVEGECPYKCDRYTPKDGVTEEPIFK